MGFLCAGLPRGAPPPPWVWRSVQCADYETLRSVPLQPSGALPPEGQGWRRGPGTLEDIPNLGSEALLGGWTPRGGFLGLKSSWVSNEHLAAQPGGAGGGLAHRGLLKRPLRSLLRHRVGICLAGFPFWVFFPCPCFRFYGLAQRGGIFWGFFGRPSPPSEKSAKEYRKKSR